MNRREFWDHYRNSDGVVTVDDFINKNLPINLAQGRAGLAYARWFLYLSRLPAALRSAFAVHIEQYKLFVRYGHTYLRCTGASRMGDIYLTANLDLDTGYEFRVRLDDPKLDYTTFVSYDPRMKPPVIAADEGREEKLNRAQHLYHYPYDTAAEVLAVHAAQQLGEQELEICGWMATTQHIIVGLKSK